MKRLLIHQAVLLNTREMILIKQVHTTQTVRLSSGQSLLIKKEMILIGAVLTDNCLKDAKNFKISSEQDTDCKGAEIQKDKEGKISGINICGYR